LPRNPARHGFGGAAKSFLPSRSAFSLSRITWPSAGFLAAATVRCQPRSPILIAKRSVYNGGAIRGTAPQIGVQTQ
jgi:hypothetical protein